MARFSLLQVDTPFRRNWPKLSPAHTLDTGAEFIQRLATAEHTFCTAAKGGDNRLSCTKLKQNHDMDVTIMRIYRSSGLQALFRATVKVSTDHGDVGLTCADRREDVRRGRCGSHGNCFKSRIAI
jgi:hypothetical protein